MKVKSSKPRGERIFKCPRLHIKGKKIKRPYWIEPLNRGLYFNPETLTWNGGNELESLRGQHSVYYAMEYLDLPDAYSLKAVKRLISKWNAPKGTWFKASLPYVEYEFKIRKS